VQKALAGLRRINLDGLRWCVFDAKGQVRDSSTDFICRMDELIRKKSVSCMLGLSVIGAWTIGIPNCCCASRQG
jgi:hypothetical protein